MTSLLKNIKETGATFTPTELADFLASEILSVFIPQDERQAIALDPSCGDGELLLSINQALSDKTSLSPMLYGYELDENHVRHSNERLQTAGVQNFSVKQADFLEDDTSLLADIIIANPPYVRTQILGEEKAQLLAEKYKLKGRVDLYYPFLIEMTHHLREGGILGVITSNRYLFTKSGKSIRQFLANNYQVLKLIDLGDTKLFDNAAVLPAILIARKKSTPSSTAHEPTFLKIYEETNKKNGCVNLAKSIYEILGEKKDGVYHVNGKAYKRTKGVLKFHDKGSDWQLLSAKEVEWVNKVNHSSAFRIKDLAKVRVGVKTTADNVFIKKKWAEVEEHLRPEKELLKPLLSQKNITRWKGVHNERSEILYPHGQVNGKKTVVDINKYPKTFSYLTSHRKQLEGRKYVIKAKRKWFEIWVPQQPRLWPKPKLVFPDISEEARFYLDLEGCVVDGNCYWISVEDAGSIDMLLLIQGVANSKLMATYHDLCFNNRLYAGRRRYFSQYVENYPLPDPNSPIAKEIIEIVKRLNENPTARVSSNGLEKELNQKVYEAFRISEDYFED